MNSMPSDTPGHHPRAGFVLIEAVASVVIVSICLLWIVQALLTNMRAGARFQERTQSLFAAQNHLGAAYASHGFSGLMASDPQALDTPYEGLSARAAENAVDDKLTRVVFTFTNTKGKTVLNVSTLIFKPDQTKSSAVINE